MRLIDDEEAYNLPTPINGKKGSVQREDQRIRALYIACCKGKNNQRMRALYIASYKGENNQRIIREEI